MSGLLSINWLINPTDQERDVYDGKILGLPLGPRKQLLSVLPACVKHMKHYWENLLKLKHGVSGLEVQDMSALGIGVLAPPKPALPSKMDRFSGTIHKVTYRASSLVVRALNVCSLLSAYQAELMEDISRQLEKGSPSPPLWKEIVTVNDLVLRNARQAIQTCGRTMTLSVAGKRAHWLNLSGLPDSEKRCIAGAAVEPGQALHL